jgi:hypothetical protein
MTALDNAVLKLKQMFAATAALQTTAEQVVRRREVRLLWTKDAEDALASTATAETPAGFVDPDGEGEFVKSIYIVPLGAVTADATDAISCSFAKRDTAGVNEADVALLTTDSDATPVGASWVAFAPIAMVLQTAVTNAVIAAGWSYTFQIEKIGSGKKCPALQVWGVFEQA